MKGNRHRRAAVETGKSQPARDRLCPCAGSSANDGAPASMDPWKRARFYNSAPINSPGADRPAASARKAVVPDAAIHGSVEAGALL